MSKPQFRKPITHEQLVLAPPEMVAIDLRVWLSQAGRRSQRSVKVWCPDTDEMLALIVGLEQVGPGPQDHAEWAGDEFERLWGLYVNPEPF